MQLYPLKRSIVSDVIKMPLRFEPNQGQTDEHVRYISRANNFYIYFMSDGVMFDDAIRMTFVDANKKLKIKGQEVLPSKSNYFIGNDEKNWHTNISNYAKIEYQNLYSGIDAIFYGNNQRELEYDFRVAPGIDPKKVHLKFEGAQSLKLDSDGSLQLITKDGKSVKMHKPIVYQKIAGDKHKISGSFVLLRKNIIGFKIGAYDKSKPLIIDPTLIFSTYFGGSGGDETGKGVVFSDVSTAYLAGSTNSLDFPVSSPFQSSNVSKQRAAFISKFQNNVLIYSTYLGGTGDFNEANAIAVDSLGNAYVTGLTNSQDFPTRNPFQSTNKGSSLTTFVTKLNSTGNNLVYSTYLGGSGGYESARGIAVDSLGNAYTTGFTNSHDFPTKNAFQSANLGSDVTAFVSKLNSSGNALVYSTYLGGEGGRDLANAIAVDSFGSAYIAGFTNSKEFPRRNAFQPQPKVNGAAITGFVTKLNSAGNGLVYSTYLGGSGGNDECNGIAVDAFGSAYVTGFTNANDFPTLNAFQSKNNGPNFNAFVTRFTTAGNKLLFSTYLGGSGGNDMANAIAIDTFGNSYVTGHTNSQDFPLRNPIQASNNGADTTVFVTKLSESGSSLRYSTYLGGSGGSDIGFAISCDTIDDVFVTGKTNSGNFPLVFPYQGVKKSPESTVFLSWIDS